MRKLNRLIITLLACVLLLGVSSVRAQRVIEYVAGMGSRDRDNPDVWILYNSVKAMHDGMTLFTDSASFDTKNNIFNAYGSVKIVVSDTTTLYGDYAIYDGTTRIADVWADTVRLIDGRTVLKTDLLSYDRNSSTGAYYHWGFTVHDSASLYSNKGFYNTDTRDLFLYDDVLLQDSNSWLETDTLRYNTRTCIASFVSPTYIYSDSSTVYSEDGSYNTDSHLACSYKSTKLTNRDTWLTADTLYFNDKEEHGEAYGHVVIVDTVNDVKCSGNMGITDQKQHYTFVTDSALIVYVDDGDTLYMHADTIWAYNNDDRELDAAKAYRNVRVYRNDTQGACDSLYYSVADSCVTMYYSPVVWYEDYQCSADTIQCHFDSSGVKLILLKNNVFAIEKVDSLKYSQLKGHNAEVYCSDGEPRHADIRGSARMVYYVLDEDKAGSRELLGVNCGVGSDMRIYFKDRKPQRVTTFGSPDMKMYPPDKVPEEEKALSGFQWQDDKRPHCPAEVFTDGRP